MRTFDTQMPGVTEHVFYETSRWFNARKSRPGRTSTQVLFAIFSEAECLLGFPYLQSKAYEPGLIMMGTLIVDQTLTLELENLLIACFSHILT